MGDVVKAHAHLTHNGYTIHYPDHLPREDDPMYKAFHLYREHHIEGAVCYVGDRVGFDECSDGPLELHHAIEFATLNAIDPKALHKDFPEVPENATKEQIAQWAESTNANFRFLCEKHHRGNGGIHHASYADFESALYVPNLLS